MTKYTFLLERLVKDSEPHQIVDGFGRTANEYEAAWKSLCENYDNENRLVMTIIEKFLAMKRLSDSPTRRQLMAIVTKTNQMVMALPRHGVNVTSWDVIIIGHLTRLLGKRSKSKWLAQNLSSTLPTLAAFLEFVKARAATAVVTEPKANQGSTNAEGPQAREQSSGPANQTNKQAKKMHTNQPTKKTEPNGSRANECKDKCPSCKEVGHRLYACPEFKKLTTATERMAEAKRHKICIRCLRLDCAPEGCTMGPCSCGGFHNKSVCEQHAAKAQASTMIAIAGKPRPPSWF